MKLSVIEPLCSKNHGFQQLSIINCPLHIDDVRDGLFNSYLQQANLSLAETIAAPPKILELEPDLSTEKCQLENRLTSKQPVWFRILVIEDDDSSRDRLCKMLRGEDIQVIEAKESMAGIKLAQRECPDLIICELMMPEIDGYGIKYFLQHDRVTKKIPLLFITTHLEHTNFDPETILMVEKGKIKPVNKEKFLDAIADKLVSPTQV